MSPPLPQSTPSPGQTVTLFGHPAGLYTLFFAEMWERFSYYGMRALLVFYMTKGFLKYTDGTAYSVYGAYTALVYMTPFFGGLIADRLIGKRRAVVVGGLLMAAGHFLMTVQEPRAFYFALALLIAGNGFFKPNVSTMVGSLYPTGSTKSDGGFTIFYIGINLGAAIAPILCGYIAERRGNFHDGFGLATIGMLVGLAVFVMPTLLTQVLVFGGAVATAVSLLIFRPDNAYATAFNIFLAIYILGTGIAALMALSREGLPDWAGRRPGWLPNQPSQSMWARNEWLVYAGTALAIPVFALLVSGFSIVRPDGKQIQLIGDATIQKFSESESRIMQALALPISEISKPAGLVLSLTGIIAFGYLILSAVRLDRVARDRMFVVLILTFFSMLFWAFFEQAGSSVNNFTDRNVDRVSERSVVTQDMVGQTVDIQPTQEQLGYTYQGEPLNLTKLEALRKDITEKSGEADATVPWTLDASHVGMGIANRNDELPASIFQAVNPGYILLFGLLLTILWSWLAKRGWEPSTPVKFALGLLQLGLGFGAFWMGAENANERGMVAVQWLMLGYLLQTTGELCLSPVGLSMICKLSPKILVSTVMGSWFLATAFSQYLAGIISLFTGIPHGESNGEIPVPAETVNVYGPVFGLIAVSALVSGVICLALVPLLKYWMHADAPDQD